MFLCVSVRDSPGFIFFCYGSMFINSCFNIGFAEFANKIGDSLENLGVSPKKKKNYSSRNYLRKDMVAGNEILGEFVSGSKNGLSTYFFCTMCERDVSMVSRGANELVRHFTSDRHWQRDVTYRVHKGMPVFNQLRQLITLTDEELSQYRSRPFKEKAVGYLFPEDRRPKHSEIRSRVPFLTMVSCLTEVWRGGGSYTMLRRLWGFFCASLAETDPLYRVTWNKPETLVSFGFGSAFLS